MNLATVALAWVLSRPGVSSVVVGASWPEQARSNAAAADLELDVEDHAQIRRAFEDLKLDPYAGIGVDPTSRTIPFFRSPGKDLAIGEDLRQELEAVAKELERCKDERPERVVPSRTFLRALPSLRRAYKAKY